MNDMDRAEAVLKRACEVCENAFVPPEVVMLMGFVNGMDGVKLKPTDAVVVAYLIGACGGSVRKLNSMAKSFVTPSQNPTA